MQIYLFKFYSVQLIIKEQGKEGMEKEINFLKKRESAVMFSLLSSNDTVCHREAEIRWELCSSYCVLLSWEYLAMFSVILKFK